MNSYDILVVGGGVSGCHAALAAARGGAKVLLIEEFGFLGGALTAMGVGPMMSFHNHLGEQLIYGSPQEMIDRLIAMGGSVGHIVDSTGYCSTVTPFDSEALKIVLEEMLLEAGVELLYHTRLIDVERGEQGIESVSIHNRCGVQSLTAKVYIDATGDGELAKLSGVPFVLGREEDNKTQPLTTNLKVGGVDSERLRAYIKDHWSEFEDKERKGRASLLDESERISMWGLYTLWHEAKGRGEISTPRDNVLFFETNTPGVYIFNTSRILGIDPTNAWDITKAEIEGRKQCWELFTFLKEHVPGFEAATLISTPVHVGIRESRHPVAKYVIKAEDLLEGKPFEHPIALGGYPIDIHSPEGGATESTHLKGRGVYSIPMECVMVAQMDNLLLAGRAIGADHNSSAAIRVTPIAMAIGQGVGTLASLAVSGGVAPKSVDYVLLRERLIAGNVRLE